MLGSNRGCLCVCVCVCLSVCVCNLYSLNGLADFDETFYKWSDQYLWGPFFSVFEISKSMVSVLVCVRVSVCLFVCVNSTAHTDWSILMKLSTNDLEDICQWHFSPILKIQNGWRHGGHFVCFSMRHSHGRNFAPIFFKIEHKVQSCLPMFAIENQQNRSVTSGNMENRVFQKNNSKLLPTIKCLKLDHPFRIF